MSQQSSNADWTANGECRTFGDITFDGAIHCGAGHDFCRLTDTHFRCRGRAGFAPYSWRLHVCIESPGDGREIILEVADFNHFGQQLWQESAAVVSHDAKTWTDLGTDNIRVVPWTQTGVSAYDDTIDDGWHPPYGVRFRLRLDQPRLWFATPTPYTLAESRQHVRALAARCAFFHVEELGPSHFSARHGYPLEVVKVAKAGDGAGRIRVVVIAGEHPAESAGMFACDGLLDELLCTHDLLSDFSFWIVPVVNVDGVAYGRTYHNLDPHDPAGPGVNLNRDWQSHTQPENRALWGLLENVRPHLFLNLHNGRHRREFELYSLPDRALPAFMRHLRRHLPLPLEHWKPPVSDGMGCREVKQAGLADHAFCLETLLLRKAPGCATFAESYRRVGRCVLRGVVAGLRDVYQRPHMNQAVQDAGDRPVRCAAQDFVAQLPSFYHSAAFEAPRPHDRYSVEVNGLPLEPGFYDVHLRLHRGSDRLDIARVGKPREEMRQTDGWISMRSVHVPAHKVSFDYAWGEDTVPFGDILICPEGMPIAEAEATARDLKHYVRETGIEKREHLRHWKRFQQRLKTWDVGHRDLMAMLDDLLQWTVDRQVTDTEHQYAGAIHSEENKFDARDAAAATAAFTWKWRTSGNPDWRERALLARRYVYRNQMHEAGNAQRDGGFLHMVQGIWGVTFTRLEPPYPGIDGVDTCAIVHLLCRAVELGLPFEDADRQVLRKAAAWIANSEVLPGVFLHHEGARHDCQNMNSLALSALSRAHAVLSAGGGTPPAAWLEAASRGLQHLLDGQEAIGVWPYIFAQVGARGQRYSEANIPDHGIGMYHLTRALACPPIAEHPGVRRALGLAARWYLCTAWLDGDTIDLEYNKRPELGSDICFSGFTWCRFTAAAALIRLAGMLDDGGPWRELGLGLMAHVRRKRWQSADPQRAPVVAHARPEAKLATWCQTAEWDAAMLTEMIDDLARQ